MMQPRYDYFLMFGLFLGCVVFSLPFVISLVLWWLGHLSGNWVLALTPLFIVGQVCRYGWEWQFARF